MDQAALVVTVAGICATAVGVAVAVGAAIYSGIQARAAKSQADSARHQVELMKRQVSLAEEANQLTERALADERKARTLDLDVSARVGKWGRYDCLEVSIENNSDVEANIQEVSAVFADGSRVRIQYAGGELLMTPTSHSFIAPSLPGLLGPGQACCFRHQPTKERKASEATAGPSPEYSAPQWRIFERVEVKASNKTFIAAEEDGLSLIRDGTATDSAQA